MAKGEGGSKTVTEQKPLTDQEKIAKKTEELQTLIATVAKKEGKSKNHQLLQSLVESSVKSFEGGKATLDWEKIGNNLAIFSRIPEPTNVDVKKILLQLMTLYIDLEVKAQKEAKKKESEEHS